MGGDLEHTTRGLSPFPASIYSLPIKFLVIKVKPVNKDKFDYCYVIADVISKVACFQQRKL